MSDRFASLEVTVHEGEMNLSIHGVGDKINKLQVGSYDETFSEEMDEGDIVIDVQTNSFSSNIWLGGIEEAKWLKEQLEREIMELEG